MIILSHGQIVTEGTLNELQEEFINRTIFEVIALTDRMSLQKSVREIDQTCELLQDEPVDVSGKKRFIFSTEKGEVVVEAILRYLVKIPDLRVFEFQIERPDLETIFLRATKKNWEENDLLGKRSRRFKIE